MTYPVQCQTIIYHNTKSKNLEKKRFFYNLNKKGIKSFSNKEVTKKNNNNTWINSLTNGFRMTCMRISFFMYTRTNEDSFKISHFLRNIYRIYFLLYQFTVQLSSFIAHNHLMFNKIYNYMSNWKSQAVSENSFIVISLRFIA